MRDFTLNAYRRYLDAIRKSYPQVLRFDHYFQYEPKPESFCIMRHDVDRKPRHALKMAEVEHDAGVAASYYFRAKRHTFNSEIICAISAMGHEIGYHYESFSDARGDMAKAIEDFEENIGELRRLVTVSTISMHGRPLSRHDNRKMWETEKRRFKLHTYFQVLGEVYLDVDYTDIAYITDTGRNWNTRKANRRDQVLSEASPSFRNGRSLLNYLNNKPHPKLVFLTHPERWTDNLIDYAVQFSLDRLVNIVKAHV